MVWFMYESVDEIEQQNSFEKLRTNYILHFTWRKQSFSFNENDE